MFGDPSADETVGLIPRMTKDLFDQITRIEEEYKENPLPTSITTARVELAFFEIYNETLVDLIGSGRDLRVRESKGRGVYVEGLVKITVKTASEIKELIDLGIAKRSVTATAMNEHSSRSHSVLQIQVSPQYVDSTSRSSACLFLADLAGSERVAKSKVQGQGMSEAVAINSSLAALGNVVHALTERGRSHIPFRDSKLTFLLRDSLGGNSRACLLMTCSPSADYVSETVSTLRFGSRCKEVKNKVSVNIVRSHAELEAEVGRLEEELGQMRELCKRLEARLARVDACECSCHKTCSAEAAPGEDVLDSQELEGDIRRVTMEMITAEGLPLTSMGDAVAALALVRRELEEANENINMHQELLDETIAKHAEATDKLDAKLAKLMRFASTQEARNDKLAEELDQTKLELEKAKTSQVMADELAKVKAQALESSLEVESLKSTVEDRDTAVESLHVQLAALKTMHEERMAQEQEAHHNAIAAADQALTQQRDALAKQQQAADAEAERRNECEQHISKLQLELHDSQEQFQSSSEALRESEAAKRTLQGALDEETMQRRLENEQATASLASKKEKAKNV
eukprot:TRINITY_DN5325_c0_g1_i9.p1 TRINITY_DN5325_c0_g1~~TRINITY_DN5325_c0_g1_i9.p1  ORF type:complete len:576 (+),score=179.76 TRINITY_DN5325_c0_g1_i9:214-1941(+)